jgi:radical SAM protein with 4Fe4S-binding SPASM domain
MVVIKENLSEYQSIKNLSKKFHLPFRFSTVIDAQLDGSKHPWKHRIPVSEGVKLEMGNQKFRNNWEKSAKDREKAIQKRKKYLYYCNGGLHTFHLNPYGNLSFCTLMQTNLNIRKKSFEEIFYKNFPKIRAELTSQRYKCNTCKIRGLCDQCPVRAKLNTDNPKKIVNYFCKYAHLRAKFLNYRKS